MIRTAALAVAAVLLASAVQAQEAGQPSLHQLELDANGGGYAVVLDADGHEYHCVAKETRETVDLGPCKPLRLVTPLDMQPTFAPPMDPTKRTIVELFERNRCVIAYADLKDAIETLAPRQQQTVARMITEMTERGEISDNEARERAVLRIGDRCS